MYDCLFEPKTHFSKIMSKKWTVFTDDVEFLKETVQLIKTSKFKECETDDFLKCWNRVQDTVDFTTVFQYIEQKQISLKRGVVV